MYSLPAHDVKEVRRACKLGIISLLPSLTRLLQVLCLLKKMISKNINLMKSVKHTKVWRACKLGIISLLPSRAVPVC